MHDFNDIRVVLETNGGDPNLRFGELWTAQIEGLRRSFGSAIEEVLAWPSYPTDVPIIFVAKDSLLKVLDHLKSSPEYAYDFLSDLTATDEESDPRFHLVYNLLSHKHRFSRIRVKTRLRENEAAPSAIGLWPGADWAEREVWDMYGIKFDGHPNLRRILMDERWEGFPLRKDYPLTGYQSFATPQEIHPEML